MHGPGRPGACRIGAVPDCSDDSRERSDITSVGGFDAVVATDWEKGTVVARLKLPNWTLMWRSSMGVTVAVPEGELVVIADMFCDMAEGDFV